MARSRKTIRTAIWDGLAELLGDSIESKGVGKILQINPNLGYSRTKHGRRKRPWSYPLVHLMVDGDIASVYVGSTHHYNMDDEDEFVREDFKLSDPESIDKIYKAVVKCCHFLIECRKQHINKRLQVFIDSASEIELAMAEMALNENV